MTALSSQTCVPCRGSEPPLSPEEMEKMRILVDNWRIVDRGGTPKLTRSYKFSNFKAALAFTQKVGEAAEQAGHHPKLITEWGKVSVFWWTHVINGLHQNDFIMAAKTDLAYEQED
ncbi:4a-hydroxytetrahydrobiopterin dehydratase [cf. Phormidesmis sp. LEGE 11477]|uniref:4a-hydroxytetrahydrobiopterin dehydratase n=1 Tax=cf. Phormidesmis sp. LEGE 11477 TaxID=1828680 RepID=UPI001882EEE1|nr:4a-hydroxytetrahydrobiopterin dehydratase [cf. Phormidesmis sp. LEGE 11477]MBE9061827.1 4a-hydroxytetrahydrobiopterin dehydratase [cf. Phormidesmis sp. LEGE 11477]